MEPLIWTAVQSQDHTTETLFFPWSLHSLTKTQSLDSLCLIALLTLTNLKRDNNIPSGGRKFSN